jgi:D-alanyl-D-alanine carboxypeptidase
MKKLLLSILAILNCVATYSQIDNPKLNLQNLQIIKKQVAAASVDQKQNELDHCTDNTMTFDSTWSNRFQTVLDSVMQATGGKGASMAVYTPEEGLWSGVSGTSNGWDTITSDMRFGIGSNTKLFIAVTVLRLQEEGILSLDDHLYQWLPSYQYIDSSTTIRQLLAHQSGIFDYWNDQPSLIYSIWADTSRFWTSEEIVASIGPPHFAPGNGFRYSNTNYVLAGMIIEEATGETWVQNLHNYIFNPLNLDSTFVGAFEPRNGPVASEWDYFFGYLITNSPMTAEYSQANACGAILATASEMVQWYSALFNGSIITDSSLQMLLSFEPSSLFGLGIIAGGEEVMYYYHTGGMLGYISIILYDIRREALIVILFNDRESNYSVKWNSLLTVFFEEYPKRSNDAGIVNIVSPWEHYCSPTLVPELELKNFGNEPLTSVSINYSLDEDIPSVYEWSGLLNTGETIQVLLPSLTTEEGAHSFCCYTSLPNGEPEGYAFNDTLRSNFFINASTPTISGLFEGFDSNSFPKDGWTLSSSSIFQWSETSLTRYSGTGSGVKNNSDMSGIYGQYSDLQLPLLNISSLYNTEFSFDYAYAPYPGYTGDSLRISVSEDCGETWQTLFYDGGYTLRTALPSYQYFYPASPDDWAHKSFSLSEFEGDILIRFRARYGASNNLFIDNILIGSPVGVEESMEAAIGHLSIITYPNPFNQFTTIGYRLKHEANVRLTIYNHFGQKVTSLVNETQIAGNHKVIWNADGLPAGIYYFRIQSGEQVGGGKMVLMR